MTDIVTRLMDYNARDTDKIMDDAAHEIVRLRDALREVRDRQPAVMEDVRSIAKEALGED